MANGYVDPKEFKPTYDRLRLGGDVYRPMYFIAHICARLWKKYSSLVSKSVQSFYYNSGGAKLKT